MGKAGGDLLHMVRDQNDSRHTVRSRRGRGRHGRQAGNQPFTVSEIEPRRRFVEHEQFRWQHERPGQQDLLTFAF